MAEEKPIQIKTNLKDREVFKILDKFKDSPTFKYTVNKFSSYSKGTILEKYWDKLKKLNSPEEMKRELISLCGDISDDEWWFNFYLIPKNDRLRNYQFLKAYTERAFSKEEEKIREIFKKVVDSSRIFEIDEETTLVLSLTDSPRTENWPYPQFILDCKLKIEDRTYYGLSAYTFELEETGEIINGFHSVYSIKEKADEQMAIETNIKVSHFDMNDKLDKYQKTLVNLVFGFINLINEPEVEIVPREFNEKNNLRREERGAMKLPRSNIIYLKGSLRRYADNIKEQMKTGRFMTHKFWVRGHYLHLRNRKRYNRLFSMEEKKLNEIGYQVKEGILIKWKKPFIKGQGILINKTYKIERETIDPIKQKVFK